MPATRHRSHASRGRRIDGIFNTTRADDKGEYLANGKRRAVGKIARPRIRRETGKARHRRLLREQAAADVIEALPEEGDQVALLLDGTYHGIDLVAAVLDLAAKPCAMHVATLSTNRTNARQIAGYIKAGAVTSASVLVSEMFSEASKAEYGAVKHELEQAGAVVAAARNHAKLVLFDFGDQKLVMHGSLNLRRCNCFEQCFITASAELYSFFFGFINDVHQGRLTP